jgi:hypothetical protein
MRARHDDQEGRTMTESQQPKRGWFSTWREHRRAQRQLALESRLFRDEHAREYGPYDGTSAYQHAGPLTYWAGGGWDGGGGCGGGDGGGGC